MKLRFSRLLLSALFAVSIFSCGSYEQDAMTPINVPDFKQPLPFQPQIPKEEIISYEIRPGDEILVEIVGRPESRLTVPVRPDGRISYHYIGEIKASGKTFRGLRADLEQRLEEFFKKPSVTLIGSGFSGHTITVIGEAISSPGRYTMKQSTRILDAMAMAGGLTLARRNETDVTIADLKKARILRDNKPLPVDLHALYINQDWRHNITLRSGDTVIIPAATRANIILLGEANASRTISWTEGLTLASVIADAGGFTDDAESTNLILVRRSKGPRSVWKVNFNLIRTGRAPDIELMPADIIYVPKSIPGHIEKFIDRLLKYTTAVQSVDDAVKILEN